MFVIDKNENFIVDGTATGIIVPIFHYDLHQLKKLSNPNYFRTLDSIEKPCYMSYHNQLQNPWTNKKIS